jgi:integrase
MAEHGTFTKRRIDAMQPRETLWDGGGREAVKGLGIRCREGGTKTFGLKYRVAGRQRWLTLGKFGSPLTVDMARNKAKKLLGEVADGRDPAEGILAEKRAGTVEDLCKSYREAVKTMPTRRGRLKAPGTLAVESGHIDRHIIPLLGTRKVPSITRRDIEKFQEQVAAGVTKATVKTTKRGKAIVKGGRGTAARCLNTLGAIFAYGVKLDLRDDNPVHGVVRFEGNAVKKFLSPAEMKSLGKAIVEAEADHPQAAAIIRLLAMTGARRSEIARLRWPWVDLHHGVLRLPNSKTGERLIVLGQSARDLIACLPRHNGTDLVFPPTRAGALYEGTPKVWRSIRDAAKITARIHDLRHHFASVAGELGYALPTISALLGHSIPGTTGRYLHHTDAALRTAADRIAAAVLARLEGRNAAVVQIGEVVAKRQEN